MRAAVTDDKQSLAVEERERPAPGRRQMLIRVAASGICGSDLRLVELAVPGKVLGHEFTGEIVELGEGVTAFEIGQRVCAVPTHTCQECLACLTGDPISCAQMRFMGSHREGIAVQGSFAEYAVVDESAALLVPDAVTRDQAAFVEPLAIALKGVERARFEIDDSVLILGAGPIGLSVLLWARTNGVGRIVVSDPVASRRALALSLGAAHAIDPTAGDVGESFTEVQGGPPDVVIECVGRSGLFDQAVNIVRPEGRVVVLGMHMGNEEFSVREPLLKSVTVAFCALYTKAHFRHALQILANGQLDPTPVITHRIGLDELADTVRALRAPNEFGKVLVLLVLTRARVSYLDDLFGLQGKRALVTGGGGGIGVACARALAGAGAAVALVDVEDATDRLAERAAEVQAAAPGAKVVTIVADVAHPASVRAMVAEATEKLGGIDIVHSNAGIISGLQPDLEVEYEAWLHNVDVNLNGVFLVGRESARAMIEQGSGGSIINTASMSGLIINHVPGKRPAGSAYGAAKAGVLHLTRAQAVQWVGHDIRVNAISPGYVRSGIHKGFTEEHFAAREALVPMGRFGAVDELAGAIVYLAGDASSYVTGANLVVDGVHLLVSARPFRIDVSDEVLADLRDRLARTRWAEPIPGVGWDYGTDIGYLRELCQYWRTGYDWRAAEARLNAHEQYLETIDGVDMHFLRVPGVGPDPFPLLLLHGWPGSVWEFMDLLGLLSDPAAHGGDPADAFDLVLPSLPGFGFSSAPRERGWGITRMAAALDELMGRCGFARYGTQGGDWGGIISAQIGSDHPGTCAAIHVNHTYPSLTDPPAEAREWVEWYRDFQTREAGYSHEQGTKPDSLTVAQNDSPAGLAAWIIEKFHSWGDTGGDIESAFDRDDLLTNVMIYWVTETAPSAARIYYERRLDAHAESRQPVTVPTAVARFPKEPFIAPRALTERRYNLVRWTDMPAGGHFPALEQPAALLDDVRAFYRSIRSGAGGPGT